MEATILRNAVYDLLQEGDPFDMEFITCSRKKSTGGELVKVESWLVCGQRLGNTG